jgi:hypothetical protein
MEEELRQLDEILDSLQEAAQEGSTKEVSSNERSV